MKNLFGCEYFLFILFYLANVEQNSTALTNEIVKSFEARVAKSLHSELQSIDRRMLKIKNYIKKIWNRGWGVAGGATLL